MIDERKVMMARDRFLKNRYWREAYGKLTPAAKRWYDLTFLFSVAEELGADEHEVAVVSNEYEKQMSYDDLCCLLVHETNGYMRHKLEKLILAAAEREDKQEREKET